jgi:hypothetical protein
VAARRRSGAPPKSSGIPERRTAAGELELDDRAAALAARVAAGTDRRGIVPAGHPDKTQVDPPHGWSRGSEQLANARDAGDNPATRSHPEHREV